VSHVLAIAGSDSSGLAGLQADLPTLRAHGCRALSAVTVVTAQDARAIRGVWEVPPGAVAQQVAVLLASFPVDAVKVGMLPSVGCVTAVASALRGFRGPVVVDPVLGDTGGGWSMPDDGVAALRSWLPDVTLITPNLCELERLGPLTGARLVKGGHGVGDELVDRLFVDGAEHWWSHPRLPGPHRGTGCRLSSAIACRLARGEAMVAAVQSAIGWLQRELRA